MKKPIALILYLLYLVSSNGATISFHYCMGKFIGVNASASEPVSKNCSKCGMAKEARKGCCNDKHEIIKRSSDQLFSTINIVIGNTIHYVNKSYPSFDNCFISAYAFVLQSAHSPPLLTEPLFIRNCVFRI